MEFRIDMGTDSGGRFMKEVGTFTAEQIGLDLVEEKMPLNFMLAASPISIPAGDAIYIMITRIH